YRGADADRRPGLPAVLAGADGGRQPSAGGVRTGGGTGRVQAGTVGGRDRVRGGFGVRAAAVPFVKSGGAAPGGVAAEPGVHRLHLPGASADGLGAGPCGPAGGAAALVLPLDRPRAVLARGGVLRADRVLHPVHQLERGVEPVRAARLPGTGAIFRDVTLTRG